MSELNKLQNEYSSNMKRIADISNEIASLTKKVEIIKKSNEHIIYCLNLLGLKDTSNLNQLDRDSSNAAKKSIKAVILDFMTENEAITIDQAWEYVKKCGIKTTKPTINSTLFALYKNGQLDRPSAGLYRKLSKDDAKEGVLP